MQDDLLNQMRNFMQNLYDGPPGEDKEPEATTDTELTSTEDIQPLPVQEPPQDSDICQLIRKKCCVEVPEKQKKSMEDAMLDALNSKLLLINSNSQRLDKKEQEVKNVVEQPAERGNRSIQSLQNFRVVHKSFISFRDTSQISLIHAIAPVPSTKEPEHLLSMGYEHLSITHETESDEVAESNAENLLPIPNSKIDDDISDYDDNFKDIEYVEASLSDPKIVSIEEENGVEEENVVQQEEEEVDFEDISQIQDVILREKLLSITRLISNIESLNDNSTPDRVLNFFEFDNSLLDNFSPEFETFCDHSEETRSELLIDNFILSHESFDSNFEDNPSIQRPPLEPPDAETDTRDEIPVVMNDKDKFNEDFYFFMFDKVFSLLSAESENTIFDPGISD
nr:hypothetical protein [Tanacetum cinerariifolium]